MSVDAVQVSLTVPETGVVTARLVGAVGGVWSPVWPVRVTVFEFADWLPAASCARTKYVTVAVSGWVSVYVSAVPDTFVISVLLAYPSYPVTPTLSVDALQVSLIWPVAGWV